MVTPETFMAGTTPISPAEVIKRYRRNMIIHSYIYYEYDDNVISDHQWQEMANDLSELQKMYPDPINYYDELFEGWDGTTGFHLTKSVDDKYWRSEALYIIRLCQQERGMNVKT